MASKTSFAVLSLLFGVLGFVFCWVPLIGLIPSVLGAYYFVQQRKIRDNILATSGLILSIFGFLMGIVVLIKMLVFFI